MERNTSRLSALQTATNKMNRAAQTPHSVLMTLIDISPWSCLAITLLCRTRRGRGSSKDSKKCCTSMSNCRRRQWTNLRAARVLGASSQVEMMSRLSQQRSVCLIVAPKTHSCISSIQTTLWSALVISTEIVTTLRIRSRMLYNTLGSNQSRRSLEKTQIYHRRLERPSRTIQSAPITHLIRKKKKLTKSISS